MADSKVLIELKLVQKGDKISVVAKETQKLGKETKKTAKSQQDLEHKTGAARRQLHGMAGMTSNSTKQFSKMQQGIGKGSSGLVGAYATLAANVFAATAAFQALRTAAQTQQLISGLEAVGDASGRNLRALAGDIRDAADGALSLDAALRSAAVGASAEFSDTQLIGLTEVAKGAALALGRDVGDAQDRLVRGAAKLEPEILDELGIFVRLDDATEKYAATIGKTASQLTNFQRRQAFTNEILEQGTKKFSDISDAVDPNPYDRLAATMADLSRQFLNFINSVLGPFAKVLSENTMLLTGLFLVVTKGIITAALPALTKMGDKLRENGIIADRRYKNEQINLEKSRAAMMKKVQAQGYGFTAYDRTIKKLATEEDKVKVLEQAYKELEKIIAKGRLGASKGTKLRAKQAKDELKDVKNAIKEEKKFTPEMISARTTKGRAEGKFERRGEKLLGELDEPGGGFKKWTDGMKESNKVGAQYRKTMKGNALATQMFGGSFKPLSKHLFKGGVALKSFSLTAKVSIKGIFTAIPFIGQIMLALDLFIMGLKKLVGWLSNFKGEASEFKKANKALAASTESVAKVLDKSKIGEKSRADALVVSSGAVGGLIAALDRQNKATKDAYAEASTFGKMWMIQVLRLKKQFALIGNVFSNMVQLMKVGVAAISVAMAKLLDSKLLRSFMNGYIRMINLVNKGSGMEPIPLITVGDTEKGVAEAEAALKRVADEYNAATSTLSLLRIDAGALSTFQAFETIMLGAGPATDELQSSLKNMNINDLVAKIASGSLKLSDFSEEMQMGLGVQELFNKEGKLSADMMKVFNIILTEGTRKTGIQGNAIKALGTAFKEEGTKVDKFMTSLGKKSSIDEALASIISFSTEMGLLGEESDTVAEKWQEASKATKAFIDSASKGEISASEKRIKAMQDRLATYDKEDASYKTLSDRIIRAQKHQGDLIIKATNDTKTLFQERKRLELTEKTILSALKRQSQAIQKAGKDNSAAVVAGIDIENTANEHAIKVLDNKITIQERTVKLMEGQRLTQTEINALTDEEQNLYYELLSLDEQRAGKKAQLVGRSEKMVRWAQAELALTKTQNQLYAAQEDALAKQFKTQTLIANVRKGLGATLTTADELQIARKAAEVKIEAATRELEMIQEKARLEIFIIAARLQAAGVENSVIRQIVAKSLEQLEIVKQIQREKIKGLEAEKEGVPYTVGGAAEATKGFSGAGMDLVSDVGGAQERINQIVADRKAMIVQAIKDEQSKEGGGDTDILKGLNDQLLTASATFGERMFMMQEATKSFGAELAKLGPEGEFAASLFQGVLEIGAAFEVLTDKTAKNFDKLAAAGSMISAIGNIAAKASQMKVAGIDREIAAEKKRDGKSAASIAKIKKLEAKKEAAKKKAFETDKKAKMAGAVIDTAAGIMKAVASLNYPMAAFIAAMGAAQLAIISSSKYEGGSSTVESAGTPPKIEVGKRTNKVDVSQQASAGELAYLRGRRGIGTTATNFIAEGGAGGLRKGYAGGKRGIHNVLVGERGPEMLQTPGPFNVVPSYAMGGSAPGGVVSFTINAIDAAGVEEVLMAQQGNIISMIRSAANDYGEEFLEAVNTDTYGDDMAGAPQSAGGIDY